MAKTPTNGHAVDAGGNVVADPSINVGALVVAEGRRQDDLRLAEARRQDDLRVAAKELTDEKNRHQKELADLRDTHNTVVSGKESGRLDSIRQIDREEVAKAYATAQTNIATLAKTTSDLAATLQDRVANTAAAAETRQNTYSTEVGKRLQAVELALSEGKGKQGVADPANERLVVAVEKLIAGGNLRTGKAEGLSTSAKILMAVVSIVAAGVTILGGLVGLAGVLYAVLKQ